LADTRKISDDFDQSASCHPPPTALLPRVVFKKKPFPMVRKLQRLPQHAKVVPMATA